MMTRIVNLRMQSIQGLLLLFVMTSGFAILQGAIIIENQTDSKVAVIVEYNDIEADVVRAFCPAERITLAPHSQHTITRQWYSNITCPLGAFVFVPFDSDIAVARILYSEFPSFTTSPRIVITNGERFKASFA